MVFSDALINHPHGVADPGTHCGTGGPVGLAAAAGFFIPASFSISPTVNCAHRIRATQRARELSSNV